MNSTFRKEKVLCLVLFAVVLATANTAHFLHVLLDNTFFRLLSEYRKTGYPVEQSLSLAASKCLLLLDVIAWGMRFFALIITGYFIASKLITKVLGIVLITIVVLQVLFGPFWL